MNFEHLIDGGLFHHNSRSNAITITHLDGTEKETKKFVSFVQSKQTWRLTYSQCKYTFRVHSDKKHGYSRYYKSIVVQNKSNLLLKNHVYNI